MSWIEEYNKTHNNEYNPYSKQGEYLIVIRHKHPRAQQNGSVYIHWLQAEKMLGRYLKPEECVHHIDKDKLNNDESNLMVFATMNEHTAFHMGAEIYKEGDVWRAIIKGLYDTCPICGGVKTREASKCLNCASSHIEFENKIKQGLRPDYYTLFNLISEYPMIKIGEMYNVSDKAVCKWCNKYGLPSNYHNIKQLREKRKNCVSPISFIF